VMRRLLAGHAVYFNRRHRGNGRRFQSCDKSVFGQGTTGANGLAAATLIRCTPVWYADRMLIGVRVF
jgi:hypothetical protein